jgi:hypothetical protein
MAASVAKLPELLRRGYPLAGRVPSQGHVAASCRRHGGAARGELPADDVAVALKMVLSMEGIRCKP